MLILVQILCINWKTYCCLNLLNMKAKMARQISQSNNKHTQTCFQCKSTFVFLLCGEWMDLFCLKILPIFCIKYAHNSSLHLIRSSPSLLASFHGIKTEDCGPSVKINITPLIMQHMMHSVSLKRKENWIIISKLLNFS